MVCACSTQTVSQEVLRKFCISEMCFAMASALKVAGLGLLNGTVALCLLTFLSSAFLQPWWGSLALDWLLKTIYTHIYQYTMAFSHEPNWMCQLRTQDVPGCPRLSRYLLFQEQGYVHLEMLEGKRSWACVNPIFLSLTLSTAP